jgi:exonuclease VII small subunit
MSGDYTDSGNDFSGGGFDEADDEDSARGGDYMTDDSGQFTGYGAGYNKSIEDAVSRNPQLGGFLGKQIQDIISKGKARDFEFDKKGQLTGVYSQAGLPGTLGVLSGLLGGPTTGSVYTGYGKGAEITGSDDGSDEPAKMIKKIVEEQKEEDLPLTEAELDYYARGMGTATKPLKSLKDVNEYMSSLIGKTGSPTGAKLSKDKKFLILPNGKIINLRTGKVQESMSGLELFRGGLI